MFVGQSKSKLKIFRQIGSDVARPCQPIERARHAVPLLGLLADGEMAEAVGRDQECDKKE
jgi:hypothetical protein